MFLFVFFFLFRFFFFFFFFLGCFGCVRTHSVVFAFGICLEKRFPCVRIVAGRAAFFRVLGIDAAPRLILLKIPLHLMYHPFEHQREREVVGKILHLAGVREKHDCFEKPSRLCVREHLHLLIGVKIQVHRFWLFHVVLLSGCCDEGFGVSPSARRPPQQVQAPPAEQTAAKAPASKNLCAGFFQKTLSLIPGKTKKIAYFYATFENFFKNIDKKTKKRSLKFFKRIKGAFLYRL